MDSFETLPFYRGVSSRYNTDHPSLLTPRRDRKPRDSSKRFHEIADEWFRQKFGVSYRSQGLFLSASSTLATTYAATAEHVMRILPTSKYRYCWSPSISDLLFVEKRCATATKEEIEQELESAGYCETDLGIAHTSGHEVMLYCDKYIAIPLSLDAQNGTIKQTQSSLIISKYS